MLSPITPDKMTVEHVEEKQEGESIEDVMLDFGTKRENNDLDIFNFLV